MYHSIYLYSNERHFESSNRVFKKLSAISSPPENKIIIDCSHLSRIHMERKFKAASLFRGTYISFHLKKYGSINTEVPLSHFRRTLKRVLKKDSKKVKNLLNFMTNCEELRLRKLILTVKQFITILSFTNCIKNLVVDQCVILLQPLSGCEPECGLITITMNNESI